MSSYCQYNDAFSNGENDKLDQMARQINDQRKKINKNVQKGFSTKYKEMCTGIDCMLDPENARYAPTNFGSDFNFFSAQGDFSSGLPTPLQEDHDNYTQEIQSSDNSDTVSFSSSDKTFGSVFQSDFDSMSKYNSEINSDLASSYSSLSPKIKKHLRLNTHHLNKYHEKDDKNIMDHMKTCNQCRTQLLQLLHNETHINNQNNLNQENKDINSILNLSTPEIKDILVLILIGIFIIILLDMFLRR